MIEDLVSNIIEELFKKAFENIQSIEHILEAKQLMGIVPEMANAYTSRIIF